MTDPRGATLAVDAGTSLIKAVVFDERGREQVVVRRSTVIDSPHPGWAEQDMTEVLDVVRSCIADAARQYARPIARLAITGQGDGAWMVGHDGKPVRPAVLWNDARAVGVVDEWTRDGTLDEAFRLNGSLGNLGLPNAILAWFLAEDPDAIGDVRDVVTCGSWLFESLTGARGLHPSDASAPWLDAMTGQYSDDLFELFGLCSVRGLIPPVLTADELTQPLRASVAESVGLEAGIPVTLAPYDVVTTATGGGSIATGSAFCILGTTLCTGAVVETISTEGAPTGLTLHGGEGQAVTRAFPTLAGTGVVEWVREMLGVEDAAALTELARGSEPGARGVRMWPYLSPAGERMPFLDADARGVIGGITFSTARADIARATLEGLAHVIRDCLNASGAQITELVVSGGGSASDLWCQVIADITGVETVRVAGTQVGAKGAMLYAVVAAGDYENLQAAARALVDRADKFTPDRSARALFDERHEDFLQTRDALSGRWRGWHRGLAQSSS
ncbi:FGGY family carbohydrate kinase [Microbacterium sp.]|uniref:FGGY family carbohydrate kinase n=1 Tax=Microbacterium sp. TaxID=51671 RepID=UPI003F996FD6